MDNLAQGVARAKIAPGPRGVPLLGSVPDFNRDALRFILLVARRYGDVAQYRMAGMTWFQINRPDGIHRVLQENNKNYGKGALTAHVLGPLLGQGLLTSEGSYWLRQRRLMQPMFHRQQIAAFGTLMTEAAEAMLARWEPHLRDGQPFDIAAEMMRVTLEVVSGALFSTRVGAEVASVNRTMALLVEDIGWRFLNPFYPRGVPTPRNQRQAAAMREMDALIANIITQRRQSGEQRDDLLGLLLATRDADTGEGMTDKQLRDEVLTLYGAGHETTATALSWTFHLLSTHPEVYRTLRAELAAVLGGRTPTTADLPNLTYTRMVIDETMRLYPPVWITNRQALADDTVCGYRIPKGAFTMLSPYVMHRHPDYWENPEGFDPERFRPERMAARPHYAYFPFLGGPRQCIGKSFAQVEAQLILATIAQHVRLEALPGFPAVPSPAVTLRPKHGMLMIAKRA